jgi:Predicted membrane protein
VVGLGPDRVGRRDGRLPDLGLGDDRPDGRRVNGASALSEDDSRAAADTTLLSASVASLVAVGLTLAEASKASGAHAVLLTIVGVLSIALGWAAIHTTFTLGYARLYYKPPIGGIDFESEPD